MEELTPVGITVSAGNITGIGGTLGTVDNAVPRADGTGGYTAQGSDIVIDDATTSTQNNVAIVNAHAGQTNSALVLSPKGSGALIVGPKPDGTTVGGDARGTNSVDLQKSRGAANQVASGTNSVLIGGGNNRVSGGYSAVFAGANNLASGIWNSAVVAGLSNTASGERSVVVGGATNISSGDSAVTIGTSNNASSTNCFAIGNGAAADRLNMQSHASGFFSFAGDAQRARFVLRNKTTTNSAVELFLNGSNTRLTIPSGKVLAFTINITGISSTGGAVAHYLRQYALKNVSGTTSEVYAPITIGTDNAAGTSIALSASDASDALVVSVTGTASTIWRWVASVDAVEIAYGT
jgi:hypothetical protein